MATFLPRNPGQGCCAEGFSSSEQFPADLAQGSLWLSCESRRAGSACEQAALPAGIRFLQKNRRIITCLRRWHTPHLLKMRVCGREPPERPQGLGFEAGSRLQRRPPPPAPEAAGGRGISSLSSPRVCEIHFSSIFAFIWFSNCLSQAISW